MVRRVSLSQLQSELRRIESRRRQQLDRVNQGIRRYNDAVRRRNHEINWAIDQYNSEVRAHNSRVRGNRARLRSELARFQAQLSTPQYGSFRTSTTVLHQAYVELETRAQRRDLTAREAELLDLSEQEDANSLELANAIIGGTDEPEEFESAIGGELSVISSELDDRWKGALFSLNPRNPDAARHFCSSAREIFTQVLDIGAPDSDVIVLLPDCDTTQQGRPTRRSKISYCLATSNTTDEGLAEFVDRDIDNIIELFDVLNQGTHGPAGTFEFSHPTGIKKRVEDGIRFLSRIVRRS